MKPKVKIRFLPEKTFRVIASIVVLCILPMLTYAQTITFSSTNPAVPSANIVLGATNQIIYYGSFAVSNSNGVNLMNIIFTPSGTFVPSDINLYTFRYNSTNSFAGSSPTYPTAVPLAAGNTVSLSINNPTFNNGNTYYFWITADISSNATLGHTLTMGALTPSNFEFTASGVTETGTMYDGGTQTLIASGPNIIIETSGLMGFSYPLGNGPSAYQSYTVSGTSLTNNVTITAPADYEISTTNGYSGFTNSIILSQSGGTLSSTTVYIRLKSGLSIGSYNESIVHSSSGATSKDVSCSGVVTCSLSPPTVTTPITYCQNATATQLTATGQSLSWQIYGSSSVGGTTDPTSAVYNASDNNNKTTSFTVSSNVSTVTISSVDWDIPANQTVTGVQVAIQTSSGGVVTNGTQTNAAITTNQGVSFIQKQTSTFTNLVLTPGNYRIALVSGSGNFGNLSPGYPQTESTGSISITGTPNNQVYYNLQFTYNKQSITAPTPNTAAIGTTNYQVTQTVAGCTSGPASIDIIVSSTCPNYFQSYQTGNWNSSATWRESTDGGKTWNTTTSTPTSNDIVTIQSTHTVTLNVAAAASIITIYGTLDVSTYTLTGTNTLTVASGGNLLIGGTSNYPTGFTTSLSIGSTVNYYKLGDQTVFTQIYSNLTLSGSGVKTTNGITVNGTLSLEGTATTPGTIASFGINSSLQYKGSSTQSILSNMVLSNKAYNLTIANAAGVNLNTNFATSNNLIVNSGTFLTIQPATALTVGDSVKNSAGTSGIVIKSSTTLANGSLIFSQPALNPSVPATVEMYSKAAASIPGPPPSSYKWQFIGIPLHSLPTTSPTFDGGYIRQMHENDSPAHWEQLSNLSPLTSFTGYEITQATAKTYVFQGQLENKDYPLTKLPFTTSGATFPGQSLIGNPYTAAIEISQIQFGSKMLKTVYLYNTGSKSDWTNAASGTLPDSLNSSTTAGQYTAIPQALAGHGSLQYQIPSMQAFLVKAQANDPNATLYIPYSSTGTVVADSVAQRSIRMLTKASSPDIWTIIDVKGSRFSDRMWIFTEPGCTHGFDNGWDGEKFMGSSLTPQIYAMEQDGNYQVNSVDDINNTYLGFRAGEDSVYTLTFTHQNMGLKYGNVYLVDSVAQHTVDITASGTQYTFMSLPTDTIEKRFKIITNTDITTNVITPVSGSTQLNVFSSRHTVYIDNKSDETGSLYLYDMTGRCIHIYNFTAQGVTTIPTDLSTGIYLAKGITKSRIITKNIIL